MKVKKASIIIISLLAVIALLSGIAITTAGGPRLVYKGTFDTWYIEPDTTIHYEEKVVESRWTIVIRGDEAIFNAKYVELNIWPVIEPPEVPGTYDLFKIRMTTDDIQQTANGYIITGTSYWLKNGVQTTEVPNTELTIEETDLETQFKMVVFGWTYPGSLTP